MSVRGAIYSILSSVDSNVWPIAVPQETTGTYIAYIIRLTPIRIQGGIEMTEVDLTLDIYAETFDLAIAKANSLYTALERLSGTYDSESLEICNWVAESEDFVPELKKFNITQDYNLKFN